MRTLGLRRRALEDYAALPAETRAVLEAYARGVNAWIAAKGRFSAPEFLFLGTPEPWEPADSLLWGETMGLWLSLNWRTELSRQSLAGRFPQQMIDDLWPPAPGDGRPDAAPAVRHAEAEIARVLAQILPRFPDPYTLPGSASNEWAVDGRHTATGAPLARRRPAPGVRLSRHLVPRPRSTPLTSTLAGATAPGVPFLVLGHNGRIAWTFTTTGADVQDVFIETAAGRRPVPDARRPPPLHRPRGAHQGPRRA